MPDFASNPTFVGPLPEPSDQYEGQPTKVAMTEAQRANGFVPDQPIAAEHLNQELNALGAGIVTLQGRATDLEGRATVSDVSAIVTRTDTTYPITLVEKPIPAANLAAGATIRFGAHVRARRGANATPTTISIEVRINGGLVYSDYVALSTTNMHVGMLRNSGEIVLAGAPAAATPLLVSGVSHSTIASSAIAIGMQDAGLSLTANLGTQIYISISAMMVPAVPGVDLTGLSGFIQQVI